MRPFNSTALHGRGLASCFSVADCENERVSLMRRASSSMEMCACMGTAMMTVREMVALQQHLLFKMATGFQMCICTTLICRMNNFGPLPLPACYQMKLWNQISATLSRIMLLFWQVAVSYAFKAFGMCV